MKYCD